MKICKNPNCKQINPQSLDSFHKRMASKDGLSRICKECIKSSPRYVGKRKNSKHKEYSEWTIGEENSFKSIYNSKSLKELCKHFNKSESSIKTKARELGLRKISFVSTFKELTNTYGYSKEGTYLIKGAVSGKAYIGSSNDISRRISEHLRYLKSGNHGNKDLQKDFNNGESFRWAIIYLGPEYRKIEAQIIDSLENCYNLNKSTKKNMLRTKKEIDKLLKKTIKDGDCLLWTGPVCKDGYGEINHLKVHRIIFHNTKEKILPGNIILHKCNNKLCVNIEHLEQGSDKDNAEDRKLAHASKVGLNWEIVDIIRARWLAGEKYREIQKDYKFSINPIIYNKTWISSDYKGFKRNVGRVNCS
jgi:group I intron endonuclease